MKFSMIIPTYNRVDFIFKTIQSALDQRGTQDFEIIVVDDGSTDATEERFKTYSHPKVHYFRKPNGERGAARNFGARKATGDYLNFFDSDDLVFPNHFLEATECVTHFGRPEVFALGMQVQDASGKILSKASGFPDPLNKTLIASNVLGCNPVFVRADIFSQFPFDETRALSGSEDWLLWLKLSARFRFRFWNQITSALIEHSGRSVLQFKEESLVSRGEILVERLREDRIFMEMHGPEQLRAIQAYRHVYTALHLALSGQKTRPLYYLVQAFRIDWKSLFRRATLGTIKNILLRFPPSSTKA